MRIGYWALAAGAVLAFPPLAAFAGGKVTVDVTAIVEHPALDATRDGIRKALEEAGYKDGGNLVFHYESAQGSPAVAAQIAQKYVGETPDVIVPIATPSAQAVVAATQDIPVVFADVTDPLGARLIEDREHPSGNVTGIASFAPLADQLNLIKEILPGTKKIGVPYNPGEANGAVLVAALRKMAPQWNVEIVVAPAMRSADVQAAAESLVGKVDVIYVPTDNTIVSALEAVIGVGADNRIPVFSGDTDSVVRGTIASVGYDYYEVGRQAGAVVVRILKGEKPGDIPVQNATGTDLFVNARAAAAMGVTIPPAVLSRARKVIH